MYFLEIFPYEKWQFQLCYTLKLSQCCALCVVVNTIQTGIWPSDRSGQNPVYLEMPPAFWSSLVVATLNLLDQIHFVVHKSCSEAHQVTQVPPALLKLSISSQMPNFSSFLLSFIQPCIYPWACYILDDLCYILQIQFVSFQTLLSILVSMVYPDQQFMLLVHGHGHGWEFLFLLLFTWYYLLSGIWCTCST